MISIVFPHHDSPENNKVLDLNLKMIEENTSATYEVLYLVNKGNAGIVYPAWDFMMRNSKYDHVLWHNSDILLAPEWDKNIWKHKDSADWIGLELVECGQIGVHPNNIHKDFGITADTFRREEFETWVREYSKNRAEYRNGFCWYSPSVWKKSFYEAMGGFTLEPSFPHPHDSLFRERCESSNARFIVANSFAYHFQRSGENQGLKAER